MTWKIDNAHSTIGFSAKHMMVATVRGQFHDFEGTLEINAEDPLRSYAEGTVQIASLSTNNADRDTHLRSPDFFDAESYPTIHLRTTRIEARGGDKYHIAADVTIKDTTREVIFDVVDEGQGRDPWGGTRRGFSATASLNRKDFGMTFNVALETGGFLVSDEIRISIDLEVVQQEQAQPDPELALA